MRVPLEWLADYVDIDLPVERLADRLTMSGLNVESIERIGAEWQDVVTGEIVELAAHPSSRNPLRVVRVNVGSDTVTIVTGAQNVSLGDKVPVVLAGGTLPFGPEDKPVVITARPMAGMTSEGMLASARELGISEDHAGIHVLPNDISIGVPLRDVIGGEVLDLEIQPNRPDTLSMIGVAREVAAVTGQQLTLPDLNVIPRSVDSVSRESVRVSIQAPDACPRYTALRLEGLRPQPSPFWLARRLQAAGIRSISLLVDITNYVMLEYGQPMHAFDASGFSSGEIIVRRARNGERLRTLDGVERTLSDEMAVIANESRVVGIAGVMGGENSEIGKDTTSILLESANFNAASVYRTAKALNLRTEASTRFEKGLPPEQTVAAAKRYLQLAAQLSSRPIRAYELSDVWINPPAPRVVDLPMGELDRVLGVTVTRDTAMDALSMDGFDVQGVDGTLRTVVPFWRRADIHAPVDLVEEVARLVGYDQIPSELPDGGPQPQASEWAEVVTTEIRESLLACGASEVVTGALTSIASMSRLVNASPVPREMAGAAPEAIPWDAIVAHPAGVYAQGATVQPLPLLNAATSERGILRLSVLPGVLDVAARNLKYADEHLAFFELARTFFPRPDDLPYERRSLVIVLTGSRRGITWQDPAPGSYSFYDMKGILAAVLNALRISSWTVEPRSHLSLHPGRSAALEINGHDAAFFGELHPRVAASFGIENWSVQVADVDVDALLMATPSSHEFQPVPRYPAARRDIALLLPSETPASNVMELVREVGGTVLESARVFDVYAGPGVPANMKSLAIGMEFRASEATLTQDEIARLVGSIVEALGTRLGANLRE